MSLGEPLTDEQKKVVEVFGEIRRKQFEAEDADRRRPRLNFIEAAVKAGFSETQADFMWEHRAREYREWMA